MKNFLTEAETRKDFLNAKIQILKKRHKILSDVTEVFEASVRGSIQDSMEKPKNNAEKLFKELEKKSARKFESYFRENWMVLEHFCKEVKKELEDSEREYIRISTLPSQKSSGTQAAKRP